MLLILTSNPCCFYIFSSIAWGLKKQVLSGTGGMSFRCTMRRLGYAPVDNMTSVLVNAICNYTCIHVAELLLIVHI